MKSSCFEELKLHGKQKIVVEGSASRERLEFYMGIFGKENVLVLCTPMAENFRSMVPVIVFHLISFKFI